jgi:hypothetical protein
MKLESLETPFPWDAETDPRSYLPDGHRFGWPVAKTAGVLECLADGGKGFKKQFVALRGKLEGAESVRADNDFNLLQDQLVNQASNKRIVWQKLQEIDFEAYDRAAAEVAQVEGELATLAVAIVDAVVPKLLEAFIADCEAQEARLALNKVPLVSEVLIDGEPVTECVLYRDEIIRRNFFSLWCLNFYFRREFQKPRFEPERPALSWLNQLFE